MPISVNQRVKARRERMKAEGLRPVQIWVPDTRLPEFAQECRRQSLAVAASDAADPELLDFMDAAWADIGDDRP